MKDDAQASGKRAGTAGTGKRVAIAAATGTAVALGGLAVADAHPFAFDPGPCGNETTEPHWSFAPDFIIGGIDAPWGEQSIRDGHNNFDSSTQYNDNETSNFFAAEVVWIENSALPLSTAAAIPEIAADANCDFTFARGEFNSLHFLNNTPGTLDHKTCTTVHEVGHVAGLEHSNDPLTWSNPLFNTPHTAAESIMRGGEHGPRCEDDPTPPLFPRAWDIIDISGKY